MAEKVVSPGVFTNEIDQTFLPAAVGDIGAAVIGPTVKGPALIPTVVSSFGDYESKFGTSFRSGSSYTQYLTSMTAEQYLKSQANLTVIRVLDGSFTPADALVHTGSTTGGGGWTGSRAESTADDTDASCIKLTTLADGYVLNNRNFDQSTADGGAGIQISGSNNTLLSGSKDNFRWEISSVLPKKGTFTLLIRKGNDTIRRKQVLETWSGLSLDPNSNNYIVKRIGDQTFDLKNSGTGTPYLQLTGSFPNKSKYVRVTALKQTVDYLDENGAVRVPAASQSLPGLGSGSWQGSFASGSNGWSGFDALGNFKHDASNSSDNYNFFEDISTGTQGYLPATANRGKTAYEDALNLLKNQDEYDINLILLPGVNQKNHSVIVDKAINVCETRGDCFVIADPVPYSTTNITEVTDEAKDYDSNYVAMYWPWVQIPDNQTGTLRWVPPSVVMAGVYAFNDSVAHPWFAPAGLNRGGIDVAVQTSRKLTHANRDDLYESNINPIASFPGQGVTVWGQKTLQKKASALDRVNVRRLLIKLKKFIASSSRFLVFEQNTTSTRNKFLSIVNPYMEQVQAQSGLTAFKVVMDGTNNTPDTIDRNILYGQIFVQPTRTAEFVVLDFTIQPTGATFPE